MLLLVQQQSFRKCLLFEVLCSLLFVAQKTTISMTVAFAHRTRLLFFLSLGPFPPRTQGCWTQPPPRPPSGPNCARTHKFSGDMASIEKLETETKKNCGRNWDLCATGNCTSTKHSWMHISQCFVKMTEVTWGNDVLFCSFSCQEDSILPKHFKLSRQEKFSSHVPSGTIHGTSLLCCFVLL